MAVAEAIEVEVRPVWSKGLKDNLFPALSWLADVQWIDDGACPECQGYSPLAADVDGLEPHELGHLRGCRLAAMIRVFGVIPDMMEA